MCMIEDIMLANIDMILVYSYSKLFIINSCFNDSFNVLCLLCRGNILGMVPLGPTILYMLYRSKGQPSSSGHIIDHMNVELSYTHGHPYEISS